jgi:hypothetical protein
MIELKTAPPLDANILAPTTVNPFSKVTETKELKSAKALSPYY